MFYVTMQLRVALKRTPVRLQDVYARLQTEGKQEEILNRYWCWARSVTCRGSLLDRGTGACRHGPVHQLVAHPSEGKDRPALQELGGAERSLHP